MQHVISKQEMKPLIKAQQGKGARYSGGSPDDLMYGQEIYGSFSRCEF